MYDSEMDENANELRSYVYGRGIDEVLVMMDPNGTDYYYLNDHLYSPAALVDEDGNVVERYEYDAYGKPTVWFADYSGNPEYGIYKNPYYFTGRRVDFLDDGAWMIQYNRNRFYDYQTGRWLNQDPIGYLGGINLYQYCSNNPILMLDPYGFGFWKDLWEMRGSIGVVVMVVGGGIALLATTPVIVGAGIGVAIVGGVLLISEIPSLWPTAEEVVGPVDEVEEEYQRMLQELYEELGIPDPSRWDDKDDKEG